MRRLELSRRHIGSRLCPTKQHSRNQTPAPAGGDRRIACLTKKSSRRVRKSRSCNTRAHAGSTSHAPSLYVGQISELAGAVAKIVYGHARPVEQVQVEVVQRSIFWILDVASALDLPRAAAYKTDGQVVMSVSVGVAEAAAIDDHRMIEQVAVTVGCR